MPRTRDPPPDIIRYGRGADLMILEGMYGDETKRAQAEKNRHMLFAEAATLAREAGAKRPAAHPLQQLH